MEPREKTGIFLSHTHTDKAFARKLATDLKNAGVRVWIDEAEILIGDSLIEKIRSGIDGMEYVGVILSPESVTSEWVKKEVELAMNQEIDGRRVKVLPLLYRKCELPGFLKGKLYANFSEEKTYYKSLGLLLKQLGSALPEKLEAECDKKRLERLKMCYPLLSAAFDAAQRGGISNVIISAILSSSIPYNELSDFWVLLAKYSPTQSFHSITNAALKFIEKFNIGYEVIQYYLDGKLLNAEQMKLLAMDMQYVTKRQSIVWCHNQLTRKIKNDVYYHSFIQEHISIISEECYEEMVAYLLYPNRGPGNYNIDSFFEAINCSGSPEPFVSRWIEWIYAGYFDGNCLEGNECAKILYKIFNEIITGKEEETTKKYSPIIVEAHGYVCGLLKSSKSVHNGLYHLVSMLQAEYKGVYSGLLESISRATGENFSREETRLFLLIQAALYFLSQLNKNPNNENARKELHDKLTEIARTDTITGIWGKCGIKVWECAS